MSNTVFYIVVSIVIIHFVIGVVFLVRKLSGPLPDESGEAEQPLEEEDSQKALD